MIFGIKEKSLILSHTVMMSQQSGDPFAALIRVNTVVQAVVSNSNRVIRGETRAEYEGRQEGQKAGRYQSKMRETDQSQNTMIKQRKMRPLWNVSRGNTRLCDECVWECGLSSTHRWVIRWTSNQSPGTGWWEMEFGERSLILGWWWPLVTTTEAGFVTHTMHIWLLLQDLPQRLKTGFVVHGHNLYNSTVQKKKKLIRFNQD